MLDTQGSRNSTSVLDVMVSILMASLSINQHRFVADAKEQGFNVFYTYKHSSTYGWICPALANTDKENFKSDTYYMYSADNIAFCPS